MASDPADSRGVDMRRAHPVARFDVPFAIHARNVGLSLKYLRQRFDGKVFIQHHAERMAGKPADFTRKRHPARQHHRHPFTFHRRSALAGGTQPALRDVPDHNVLLYPVARGDGGAHDPGMTHIAQGMSNRKLWIHERH